MKRNRNGLMNEEAFVVFCVISIVAILLIGGYCTWRDWPRLSQGTIIEKVHQNPKSDWTISPIIGGNGGFVLNDSSTPEKWGVVIEGVYEGKLRLETRELDRYVWEKVKVGDSWPVHESSSR